MLLADRRFTRFTRFTPHFGRRSTWKPLPRLLPQPQQVRELQEMVQQCQEKDTMSIIYQDKLKT